MDGPPHEQGRNQEGKTSWQEGPLCLEEGNKWELQNNFDDQTNQEMPDGETAEVHGLENGR